MTDAKENEMLSVKKLSVSFGGKTLLKNIVLEVADGARHLLRGANGSGKTSLVQAVAGNPDYKVDGGEIIFDGRDITGIEASARARAGLFVGAQTVPEIAGLSVSSFLKHSMSAHDPKLSSGEFFQRLNAARARLSVPESWMGRSVNAGFSGGEKKRLMFLHLLLLQPKLAILDEPDSGVDADAQKTFADVIAEMNGARRATTFLVISHQDKFTEMLSPTATSALSNGEIVV